MSTTQKFTIFVFAFEAGLGLVAILVGLGLGFDPLLKGEFDKPASELAVACLWGIGATLPLVIAFMIFDRLPDVLTDFKRQVSAVLVPMFKGLSVMQIGMISAAAGWGEELMFRGLMQGGLQLWMGEPYGWAIALATASVVFGICHWLNTTYAIITTFAGLYLGSLFLLADGLLVPIIAHGLYDFVAIIYLTRVSRPSPGPIRLDEENS